VPGPRIVRVSLIPRLTPESREELRRITGQPGTLVDVDASKAQSSRKLVEMIRTKEPDAIFIDGPVPPNTQSVRKMADEYPVVEMHRELVPSREPNQPAGVHEQRLALRDEAGDLTPLRDGQLGEEISRQRERRDIGYDY
jgi:hypothetical protein